MTLLWRQVVALVNKDLLLLFNPKSRVSTLWRSMLIPVIFAMYMSVILKVYWPKEEYGIGKPTHILPLQEAMQHSTGGRDTLVLVNSVSPDGDIDRVIHLIAQSLSSSGKTIKIFNDNLEMIKTCQSSLQGTTKCYGAVIFNSSPNEGPHGIWNYSIRADASFGTHVDMGKTTNDVEIYQLPLQRAVDAAIASVNSTGDAVALSSRVEEFPFTSQTQKEWKDGIVVSIQKGIYGYISIVWYIGFVGVMYQLVGLMAREREIGMSDLIESMMPNVRRWEPQLARLIAHHVAFTFTYAPSWIIMAVFFKVGLFPYTSIGILIIFFILAGLALISASIFGAAFFRKAQLSGITCVVLALLLGIIAQIEAKKMNGGTVAVLGLLFTPMTFVFFLSWAARWEASKKPANLLQSAPGSHWKLAGGVLWILLVIQIFMYPLIAVYIERWFYGVASKRPRREVSWDDGEKEVTVQLTNYKKIYRKNWVLRLVASLIRRRFESDCTAIDDLSLSALKGQIMVLVGVNGCGKTTVLNAIAGLSSITGGTIAVDGSGGIGLCPQKNVLWNGLTVEQHAEVFYKLKTVTPGNVKEDINNLIALCTLNEKRKSYARTLSGGQKRKLQLIMMLIGGSRVCCVDEVSGGLDPLSRRRVWDILLAERGKRTFILTTHFLDEAEYLADHMTIISKGRLKAEGSTSELKARLGNGYRFTVPPGMENLTETEVAGLSGKLHAEETFSTPDPATALEKIKSYKAAGVKNFQIAGPTIEEVFMKLAVEEDARVSFGDQLAHEAFLKAQHSDGSGAEKGSVVVDAKADDANLLTGRRINSLHQALILVKKRLTILRWNWIGYLACFLIPIIAAGMVSLLLKHFKNPGCAFLDQIHLSDSFNLSDTLQPELVIGPPDALTPQRLQLFSRSLPNSTQGQNLTSLFTSIHTVNTLRDFNNLTQTNFSTIVPGGIFFGSGDSPPTFNYRSNIGTLGIYSAMYLQNAMNIVLTNQSISTSYAVFDIPWPSRTQDSLQFVFYFGLVMAAYPAFFALYPTLERLRGVRELQYSNGVRSLPLWLAYLMFDGTIVLFISAIVTIIFAATVPDAWYNLGDLFVCLFLYGIASINLSYLISLFAKSQLAAFAFSAGGQAFMLVMYMSAYMTITARSPPDQVVNQILLVHFTLGLITPIGQLVRAMIIGLNLFSVLCTGSPPVKSSHPEHLKFYGGPILYLIGQSLVLFGLFIWYDHKFAIKGLHRNKLPPRDLEDTTTNEPEVSEEIARATNSDDGLRVLHVSKAFKSFSTGTVQAVDNLTFGIKRGEVFALVGPNGAGKSTTITMLRGEIKPDRGEMFIENHPLATRIDIARAHLGVCPQHDALDQMTVLEHLKFYAGIRGVKNITRNVEALVKAVGLAPFADRMAHKLSGGNKRKLSLAIALIGNPEVLLLDEPSSGMDPLAKRSMWKTLSRFVPHRSILLTTHSMEEADVLADRVGVLAKHMLDVGTTSHLRSKHGYGFHIHLVLTSAPHSSTEEMNTITTFIQEKFPGAEMERQPYHGQMRFNIPATTPTPSATPSSSSNQEGGASKEKEEVSVGSLFVLLEENKQALGVEFYSVSVSTFDEVFLKVVKKHGIGEEDHSPNVPKWKQFFVKYWFLLLLI